MHTRALRDSGGDSGPIVRVAYDICGGIRAEESSGCYTISNLPSGLSHPYPINIST